MVGVYCPPRPSINISVMLVDIQNYLKIHTHMSRMNESLVDLVLGKAQFGHKQVWFTKSDVKALLKLAIEHKQAELDLVMFKFCPEEMSEQQLVEWEKRQEPVAVDVYNEVCRSLGLPELKQ